MRADSVSPPESDSTASSCSSVSVPLPVPDSAARVTELGGVEVGVAAEELAVAPESGEPGLGTGFTRVEVTVGVVEEVAVAVGLEVVIELVVGLAVVELPLVPGGGGRGVLKAQIASCILTACPGVKWVMHESKE